MVLGKPTVLAPATSSSSTADAAAPAQCPSAQRGASVKDISLLPEEVEFPFGGNDADDFLKDSQMPEGHVQLFRQLQSKWQCYDAYCRVSMGLGVNQMLQVLSYYGVCHTLVENHSPTTGFSLVVLFQCMTVALAVLDLAGLKRREIIIVQIVGVMPCILTACAVAAGDRNAKGVLDPESNFSVAPLCSLFTVMWLELWLRLSAPARDESQLPRRFRQMLFLDVFGDAMGWDPTRAEATPVPEDRLDMPFDRSVSYGEEMDEMMDDAALRASSQAALAQHAVRRWRSVPEWALSEMQCRELARLQDQLNNWGNTIKAELERSSALRGGDVEELASDTIEKELRPWRALSAKERREDPFRGSLVGPFVSDSVDVGFYYDVEGEATLFDDSLVETRPGATVLSLQSVTAILQDLERDARRLLELRIIHDLRAETARRRGLGQASTASLHEPARRVTDSFPNLAELMHNKHRRKLKRGLKSTGSRAKYSTGLRAAAASFEDLTEGVQRDDEGLDERDACRTTSEESKLEERRPKDKDLTARVVGHHAHMKERLPWQILSSVTRVLQGCWMWTFGMAFLREIKVYQHDFGVGIMQERSGEEGEERRLCASDTWDVDRVEVEWPHRSFFRPQSLFCTQDGHADFTLGSAFAFYSAKDAGVQGLRLDEVARSRLPASTAAFCGPWASEAPVSPSSPWIRSCLFAAPTKGGVEFWSANDSPARSSHATVALEGQPWKVLAGAAMHCSNVTRLLPAINAVTTWCLMLVGWDGDAFPIAVVYLPESTARTPEAAVNALGTPVSAGVVRTLKRGGASEAIVALHLEPDSGRLWALAAGGALAAWDIFSAQSLGRWRPRWAPKVAFRPLAICEHPTRGLLALGVAGGRDPMLLSARRVSGGVFF